MAEIELLTPDSPAAATSAFGDGTDVTVIGGGTIVMPLVTHGWIRPTRALLLAGAGLDTVTVENGTVTVGAMTPIAALTEMTDPVGACAANIADVEIRSQGTVGGNLCAVAPPEHPTGDLQAALIAVDAVVRSAGAGGEREEPVEDFLADPDNRLLLGVTFDEPSAGAFDSLDRPHAPHPTPLSVSGARVADGSVRLAATGGGPTAVRLRAAEAHAGDLEAAGVAALDDVVLVDDAVASAWYRERILPLLVRSVLTQLG